MIDTFMEVFRSIRAIRYRKKLAASAEIGICFNKSLAHSKTYVLECAIRNLSSDPARIHIGDNCNLSVSIFCNTLGKVEIGNYVFMNGRCSIRVDHMVRIGSHCLFGPRVTISDTDSHPLSRAARHLQAEEIPLRLIDTYLADGGPVIIGDDVWVGMDSLILGGVTIGEGSVIAAHSVVTKDIPPMSIAAGIPARVIAQVPD